MALNCSSPSLLMSDDCYCAGKILGCGCWSEEASPQSSCGINSLWWDELESDLEEGVEDSDPADQLPNDPFEMNLEDIASVSDPFDMNMEATSATITAAIANCIGDLTARSGGSPFGSGGNDDFIVDLLNYTFVLNPNPCIDGYTGNLEGSFWSGGPSGGGGGGGACQSIWYPPHVLRSQLSGFVEGPSSSLDAALVCHDAVDEALGGFAENPSTSHNASPGLEENDAHPGMFVALGYLGLRDVLSVEMVCKSLRAAVRSEFCSWKCIHIDSYLGEKISDADLLRLTQKSPGVLQCLSLVRCKNITDKGLKAVLQSNPQMTKLGIFGNVRITHQGLVDNLKSFNMEASIGIKKLRVANLATLCEEQYEELLSLLKIDKGLALHKQEPRIFHADCFLPDHHVGCAPDCSLPDLHDEYALDIEKCPLCEKYKHIYDCPSEGCNKRTGTCRGCLVCIVRCLRCGRCIDHENDEFVETFCLDSLCRRCEMDRDSSAAEK